MRTAIGLFVFALCCSLTTAAAQILANGGCGCRLSGATMSCACAAGMSTNKQNVPSEPSQLIETHLTIAPDSLLTKGIPGDDEVFIPMGIGSLVNEAKSPVVQISIGEVSMFLMPKCEPYRLRNVGKQDLTVRIIRIHHTDSACQ
jgi:hypothetical protein